LWFAALLLGGLVGCVIIPTPEHGLLEGRGKIDAADIAFLRQGETRREEVVLRFGEPDLILDQDAILVYRWEVSHGYWFVGGQGGAAGGPIGKTYLFMLEFDAGGRLKRFETSGSIWKSPKVRLDQWTPPEAEKLSRPPVYVINPVPQIRTQRYPSLRPANPVRCQMGEFRPEGKAPATDRNIGHMTAFGVILADVETRRPVADVVRATVAAGLEAVGCEIVTENADIVVSADIAELGVSTSVGLWTWEAVGSLDVTLKLYAPAPALDPLCRRYQSRQIVKTTNGPGEEDFDRVVRACLEDLQRQMAADAALVQALGRRRP
jgi:hypothetical protein